MISVTFKGSVQRATVVIPKETTVDKALTDNQLKTVKVDYWLDGMQLSERELEKSFQELGVTDQCHLAVVEKKDGAAMR